MVILEIERLLKEFGGITAVNNVSFKVKSGEIRAIIGPNGAGKSNIADAIVFVLGKTSARALRAKKAQELIFHGGNNKPESEYAKVTLDFSNEDKKFSFEDEILSVSRRINQKGISTYRLNGKVVTRQQILDIFSQAGIRPDGYNIIQQGDVNQIIDMNPIERRGIIDEISGIMEYLSLIHI